MMARVFARPTFLSDGRADLKRVCQPTLIIECRNDVVAALRSPRPRAAGEFVRRYRLTIATIAERGIVDSVTSWVIW